MYRVGKVEKTMILLLMMTALAFCICFPLAQPTQAIGLTPPELHDLLILRNSTQLKYLTLSKDPDQIKDDYEYFTEVRSDEKGIIEVEPKIEILAGRQSTVVPFTINTKDLANGTYSAVLLFYEHKKGDPEKITQEEIERGEVGTGVSIVAGIAAKIEFRVDGEERLSYTINNIQAHTTETDDPVPIEFVVVNTGNVSWRPEKVEFIFADQLDSQNTQIVTVSGAEINSTGPGEEQNVSLSLTPKLIQSTYTVTAVFYYDGEEVERQESQVFDVFPPNTLAQSGEFSDVASNKTQYSVGENIRVNANFQNTGEIRVSGVMVTSIEKEGTITDIRKTSQLDIDAGETSEFEDIFTLDDPGRYTLTLYVEYGNKKTVKKSIEIEVIDPNAATTAALPWILLIALSVCIIVIAFVARIVRRRKGQHQPLAQSSARADGRKGASQQKPSPDEMR